MSALVHVEPSAVRRAEQAALDADARSVLDNPGATPARQRLRARIAFNDDALDDVVAAIQRGLVSARTGR